MVIKEYLIQTDKIALEDAIKIKKEVFFRQHPDIKKDKDFKELMTIEVINHTKDRKIIQFRIDE